MPSARRPRLLALFATSGLVVACGQEPVDVGSASASGTGETTTGGETATSEPTTTATTDETTGAMTSAGVTTSVVTSTTGPGTTDPGTTGGENSGPQAVDDAYITWQKEVLSVGVGDGLLSNDEDSDGDTLMIVAADGVSEQGGVVSVEELGNFTYQPPPELWGEDAFEYTIWDGVDGFSTATVRITVNPSAIDLGDLVGSDGGFVINGEAPGDGAGNAVAGAGDLGGDGYADVIVGARLSAAQGIKSGSSYVVFGGATPGIVDLFNFAEGDEQDQGFAIRGEGPDHEAGIAVAGGLDIDGDGQDDVLIGAHQAEGVGLLAGRGYVVSGKGDGGLVALTAVAAELGGLIVDPEAQLHFLGRAISGAGDVNGDGFSDLIVGAFGAGTALFAGRSYVVFGGISESVPLHKVPESVLTTEGEAELDFSGFAVAGGGDINGDGFDDLVIGAYGSDVGGNASGRTYVVFGGSEGPGQVLLSEVAAENGGFAVDGAIADDQSGTAVAVVGDVNGDGFADFAVGAPFADPQGNASGQVYVIFGEAAPKTRSLAAIAGGDGGFAINGQAFRNYAGIAVAGAGDVDGDGLDDLIVGAYGATPKGKESGRAYVIFGKTDTAPVNLHTIVSGKGGFALQGEAAEDRAGIAVGGAGDVNGDGFADLIVGAPGSDAKGKDAGRAYVVYGGDYSNVVDLLGGQGNDDLVGSPAAEIIVGGRGHDTLRGNGGADVLYGGSGNDRFEIADATFRRIDGGSGSDTVRLVGEAIVLDLTLLADNALRSVEAIDLVGGGNTLILEHRQLRRLVGPSRTLTIDGQEGDTAEVDLGGGGFVDAGEVEGFAVYESPALRLRVAVAVDLTVTL